MPVIRYMIKSINVKNVATFDNQGIVIDDLKRINFIYGGNGSGKTTIANYLDGLSREPSAHYKDCSVDWIDNEREEIRVYSKNFKENNVVNAVGMPGVFTLGSASKEAKEKIDNLKEEIQEIQKEINQHENSIKALNSKETAHYENLRSDLWTTIYKAHEYYSEVLKGYKTKENFASKIMEEVGHLSAESGVNIELPEEKDLKKHYDILFAPDNQAEYPLISFPNENGKIESIINNKIWESKITGKQDVGISGLIDKLNSSDWILKGKHFLKEDSDICPFCQQPTITPTFRQQLEDYFDESYRDKLSQLEKSKSSYEEVAKSLMDKLEEIAQMSKTVLKDFIDADMVDICISQIRKDDEYNKVMISDKQKEPSRSVELKHFKREMERLAEIINATNNKIEEHNKIIRNKETEKRNFKDELWRIMAIKARDEVNEYNKKRKGTEKGISSLTNKRNDYLKIKREKENEITILGNSITSIRPTIDRMNGTLRLYGFNTFSIVESVKAPGCYEIQREDGTIATKTLSEGELTFISFLYFIQLSNGSTDKNKISNNRILVIDDPISSLDSSSLFVVSSMLKEIFKKIRDDKEYVKNDIKQVILFTHNVYFHKEVTFVDRRSKDNDTRFWILRKNKESSTIECYDKNNPIHSSYELLWKELKKSQENNEHISAQNIMRRIVETYFVVFGGWKDENIMEIFDKPEEKEIVRSLLVWYNQGSHDVFDDLEVEQPSETVLKYHNVFRLLFERTGHIAHYKMMMGEKEEDNQGEVEASV